MVTITLNGDSSELACNLFPPLEVENNSEIALISFQGYNSIPNITPSNNCVAILVRQGAIQDDDFYNHYIEIPTGSYEVSAIETYIKNNLPEEVKFFELKPNLTTLKCELKCSNAVSFAVANSIGPMLGFTGLIEYDANVMHESEQIIKITSVNCINVSCNLITSSFVDGTLSHNIHQFYPHVNPGYKITEIPRHLVYYPLTTNFITHVELRITDQKGNLIDFRGEPITIRLHMKRSHS